MYWKASPTSPKVTLDRKADHGNREHYDVVWERKIALRALEINSIDTKAVKGCCLGFKYFSSVI